MTTFTIHQAKTQLSELIRRAEAGEEIVIARGDVPVVALKKLDHETKSAKRMTGRGSLAGKLPPIPDEALIGGLTDAELAEAFGDEFAGLQPGQPKP